MEEFKQLCHREFSGMVIDAFNIMQECEEQEVPLNYEVLVSKVESHRVNLETVFKQFRARHKKVDISDAETEIKKEYSGILVDFMEEIKKSSEENQAPNIGRLQTNIENRRLKVNNLISEIEKKINKKGWW